MITSSAILRMVHQLVIDSLIINNRNFVLKVDLGRGHMQQATEQTCFFYRQNFAGQNPTVSCSDAADAAEHFGWSLIHCSMN